MFIIDHFAGSYIKSDHTSAFDNIDSIIYDRFH